MLATKETSKEKEVKEVKEEKVVKPVETKETKSKKEDFAIRHLTEEENKALVEDKEPVEGYLNRAPEAEKEEEEEEKKPVEKKAEKPAEKTAEEKKDFFERVEAELVKPEGKEELNEFTPREKAYFYQMRRDRKLRQQAEEDRDKALFREAKSKQETKKEEKPEEDDLEKFFKDMDPEDYLTVKEVKEVLSKAKAKPEPKRNAEEDEALRIMQTNYLKLSEEKAKVGRDDFDAVMELAEDLIGKNQEAINEVSARTIKGENPAVAMYEVIKKHKDFDTLYPAAEVKAAARKKATEKKDTSVNTSSVTAPTPEDKAKEEKAKQVEKTLEENTNRTKTTAHVSSLEGKPTEELTMDEIAKMSDLTFAKLPKAVRERYLKKYGA